MIIGGREFKQGNTYIMGILNVTPDSFSDGGRYIDKDMALRRAEEMLHEGADVIDVGGESTRPGFSAVRAGEEMERVIPVIERIKSEFGALVSVDTSKSKVAREAVRAGADIINDVSGLKGDDYMAGEIAKSGAVCVIMHNRPEPVEDDLALRDTIASDLEESLKLAFTDGISNDKIILDPGIGFGKTHRQNLMVLGSGDLMMPPGYPVLLGASRKSVLGRGLGLPPEDRLPGTLLTTILAARARALFVRVHDVRENYRILKMNQEIFEASLLR